MHHRPIPVGIEPPSTRSGDNPDALADILRDRHRRPLAPDRRGFRIDQWPPPVVKSCPPSPGYCCAGHDPNQALIEAASFGRDTDTIADVLSCLVGALHGASALKPNWADDIEHANHDSFAEASDGRPASFTSTATDVASHC